MMTMSSILSWSHYTVMLRPARSRPGLDRVVILIVLMIVIVATINAAAVGVVVKVSR